MKTKLNSHNASRSTNNGHVFVVAEIGANHNGSLDEAIALIDMAKLAGADFVKFQKRNPHLSIPEDQKTKIRETKEWGSISYLEYRLKLELGINEYKKINDYCETKKIPWFASVWDSDSISFLRPFSIPLLKIPSACLTSHSLLRLAKETKIPLYLSTGMSTIEEIREAVSILGENGLWLAQSTSAYPCPPEQINLRMIKTLEKLFPNAVIGYSGHGLGITPCLGAVALGARFVEKHITLDHSATGTDHRISLSPEELKLLISEIRVLEAALGNGVKEVYQSEIPFLKKLRPEIEASEFSV